eukprot:TRINITY_DN67886_c0_g2_i1.p1 TRINITY_DN67886_c0_g2~~TRINITY_DN67886_c0_g2_i1.p1  ORF type:complete len:151 (-),score=22.90 TRINITY_DN67886_c0_g2_i1:6-458(-)
MVTQLGAVSMHCANLTTSGWIRKEKGVLVLFVQLEGKTYTAEEKLRTLNNNCPSGHRVVIVLDEFHMLTVEQKKDAMRLLASKTKVYKMAIANHFDSSDEEVHAACFQKELEITSCAPTCGKVLCSCIELVWISGRAITIVLLVAFDCWQ